MADKRKKKPRNNWEKLVSAFEDMDLNPFDEVSLKFEGDARERAFAKMLKADPERAQEVFPDLFKKVSDKKAEGGDTKEPEWDLSSKEYDGKEINVITFKDGKELTLPEIEYMFEKNKSAPEPVPSKTTSKVILNFLEERNPTREEFINYFSGKKLNKGGTTMKDQMSIFEEGGLKEEGGLVDEESGNDVPIGSTKEEVRDDIPAMLSEGEFVFPADVVRYHGLERLMELRQEAKMGLKKMEAMGQMGNADEATLPDDIPFTVDDLIIISEPMEMEKPEKKAHGGVLHANQGTFVPSTPQQQISTGIVGNQQSIYAGPNAGMPNVNSNAGFVPPSSVIPMNPVTQAPYTPVPAPTTGYSPLYQTTPTPIVAPTFEATADDFVDDVSDAYKKVKYINPATGEIIYIDEHLGNPVQAVPAGFIRYSDWIAGGGQPTTGGTGGTGTGSTGTGTTSVSTTQTIAPSTDDGDKATIRELKDTADRERAQIAFDKKQVDLKEGSADTLLDRWLDNKRTLGAGQSLSFLNPLIGGVATAAGLREQKQLEEALDKRFPDWRTGKGLSAESAQKLKDYEEAGFFRNSKAFGNQLFKDAKEAVQGFTSSFTKEGRTTAYTNYAKRIKDEGPQYDVADNRLSGGATGFEAVTDDSGAIQMNQHGMPQSSGNLSLKEQQSYDAAVARGDASVANHHAIISAHRDRQNRYADALANGDTATAEAIGANMSPESRDQAERFGGSVHRASESGTASKPTSSGTGFFSLFVPNNDNDSDSDSDNNSGSNTGGYSCYVATALNDKGYWPTIKKIKLIKWCMDAKPEDKFDTKLWRNGYTVFGKTVIAPHVDNKIIQWLSDGFYDSRVKNKKDVKSLIGLLFFYIPSYTIALYKMLRNDLVDIERT